MLELVGLKALWLKGPEALGIWPCADVKGAGDRLQCCKVFPGWDEASGLRGESVLGWGEVTHWLCWFQLSWDMFVLLML